MKLSDNKSASPRRSKSTPTKLAGTGARSPGSARSEAPRARLIAIAEKLFAERGIVAVSLNDVNRAAGQRNKNASHYYFGDKRGLLQALLDKHESRIAARQSQLIAEVEASGAMTPRNVVRTMIQPLAEMLLDVENGGRNYLRFSAQLVVGHTLAALELRESSLKITVPPRLQTLLATFLHDMPPAIANQRAILAAVLVTQAMAEWARILDAEGPLSGLGSTESFVSNLIDTVASLYTLSPSEETLCAATVLPR